MSTPRPWKIHKHLLKDYQKPDYSKDYFVSTPDNKYGILVYNIDEWRMLSYAGFVAIYSTPESPILQLNSKESWIWFDNENTFYYFQQSNCFAFRKPAYKPKHPKSGDPFLIINFEKRAFGFIRFDATSIYYGLEEIEASKVKLFVAHPKELASLKGKKRTNEVINLDHLEWFDLKYFDHALEAYLYPKAFEKRVNKKSMFSFIFDRFKK